MSYTHDYNCECDACQNCDAEFVRAVMEGRDDDLVATETFAYLVGLFDYNEPRELEA